MNIISRKSLAQEAKMKLAKGEIGYVESVPFVKSAMGGNHSRMSQEARFNAISSITEIDSNVACSMNMSSIKGSGFDIPMVWGNDGQEMSVREKINSGYFMSSNTLPSDWDNLWDATKIDITTRKTANPTIRQEIYNVITDPSFSRTVNVSEINPFGVVFEENNGHGQAVNQGESMGGSFDSFNIVIYAAGFTWDLVAKLFDRTITPERLMDAVMVGYNALKDDLAISPILNFSYSGDQVTDANSTADAGRQELLYLTLEDADDDLGNREHPVTGKKLNTMNSIFLATSYDAKHIARVASGLPSTNEKSYPALSHIGKIIAYDGETIKLRDRTISYEGVTQGTAYQLISVSSMDGNYMDIAVKNALMIEVDENPDVKTLAQRQEAYWFAEGIWYEGIQYFVQEIDLPEW